MGFKKGKPGKDKKKKKSKGKKDEWSLEGGQALDQDAAKSEEEEQAAKRIRRETQDRDERFRRSRQKRMVDKEKKDFKNKMANKVAFTDVLSDEESNGSGSDTEEKELKKAPRSQSTLSQLDRLNLFVSKSLKKRAFSSEDQSGEQDPGEFCKGQEGSGEEDAEEEDCEKRSDGNNSEDERTKRNSLLPEHFADCFFGTKENTVYSSASTGKQAMKKVLTIPTIGDLFGELNFDPEQVPRPISSFLKFPSLHKLWQNMRDSSEEDRGSADISFSDIGANILPFLKTFSDAFLEGRDEVNDDEFVDVMACHAISHVMTARGKVLKHNQKLKSVGGEKAIDHAESMQPNSKKIKLEKKAAKASKSAHKTAVDMQAAAAIVSLEEAEGLLAEDVSVMHDQGYTRPRVLILCPFRSQAKLLVDAIGDLLGPNTSVTGMEKFEEEFGPEEDEDEALHDDHHTYINKSSSKDKDRGQKSNVKKVESLRASKKPPDWLATFKDNTDDDFKLGIQINPGKGKGSGGEKGVHMRLFSDFYISDIIIASPIGLRLSMEKNSSGGDSKRAKSDCDFLSSIEIMILQQADVMYMQNWEHVEYVLQHANRLPQENRDTDFSRVRPYFLEGQAAVHRQLIVNTQFNDPEIQATFRQYAQSLAGRLRLRKNRSDGVINQVVNTSTQVFQRIPRVKSFAEQEEQRFSYFRESILDPLLRNMQSRTLIVAPSYLHYVRIRNYLIQQESNAAFICEYSRESEISRGRSKFFNGLNDILLYSGRAHFFRRFFLRGAQHLIFYSLPQYAHFYSEIVNMLSEADVDHHSKTGSSGGAAKLSCLVLFTQYDRMALERVVGSERCNHILSAENTMTFMFK